MHRCSLTSRILTLDRGSLQMPLVGLDREKGRCIVDWTPAGFPVVSSLDLDACVAYGPRFRFPNGKRVSPFLAIFFVTCPCSAYRMHASVSISTHGRPWKWSRPSASNRSTLHLHSRCSGSPLAPSPDHIQRCPLHVAVPRPILLSSRVLIQ